MLLNSFNDDGVSVLDFVVRRFEVELTTPEHLFMAQEEELTTENHNMFFIAKGDCDVWIKDKIGEVYEDDRHATLYPGDHFGVSTISPTLLMCSHRKSL